MNQKLKYYFFALILTVNTGCGFNYDKEIEPGPLNELIAQNAAPVILDARSLGEYQSGHVPGAIHFPISQARNYLPKISAFKNKEIVIYCERGVRASKVADFLRTQGFENLTHLSGDMQMWRKLKQPIQR